MKTKLLLMAVLMLGALSFAQTSAETAGIAVQGIARDDNNTARSNATVNLKFTIYYLDTNNQIQEIYVDNESLSTDSFGIFSHIVDPGAVNNVVIANTQAYLKIEEGQTIISDEPLKHVPYAISANNGVPTGSIMPYMGTTAPYGWALCNGQDLSSVPGSATLRTLLGSNTAPDLRGMFLRGVGTNSLTSVTTSLGGVQDDNFIAHNHYVNLTTSFQGNHNHDNGANRFLVKKDGTNTSDGQDNNDPGFLNEISVQDDGGAILPAGAHLHTVTGNTDNSGQSETRPVNYGVNYIIKL